MSVSKDNRSYVQWGAIIGGAVIATAISTIMTVFGSAIGLSMASADFERSSSATALAIAGALWALWVMASATMAGGDSAGRMRHPSFDANAEEHKVRDATHGLLVWVTGALLITVVATSSLFGGAKTAASGVANASSGMASLVSQNVDPLAMPLYNIMRANGQQPPTAQERDEASRVFVQWHRGWRRAWASANRMRRSVSTTPMRSSRRPRKRPSKLRSVRERWPC